jgi:WD40 repeat protein
LRSIEWSPDGELFATSSRGGRVKVWDTRTWTEILVFDRRDRAQMDQGGRHNGLAFSADGLHLIAPTERGEIIIWDVVTGDELVRVRGHTAHAKCVALSPDGTRLATAGGDGKLKIWDASRIGELREVIRVEDEALEHIWSLAWHPDGRRLLSAEPRPGSLRIWDARTAYEAEDP